MYKTCWECCVNMGRWRGSWALWCKTRSFQLWAVLAWWLVLGCAGYMVKGLNPIRVIWDFLDWLLPRVGSAVTWLGRLWLDWEGWDLTGSAVTWLGRLGLDWEGWDLTGKAVTSHRSASSCWRMRLCGVALIWLMVPHIPALLTLGWIWQYAWSVAVSWSVAVPNGLYLKWTPLASSFVILIYHCLTGSLTLHTIMLLCDAGLSVSAPFLTFTRILPSWWTAPKKQNKLLTPSLPGFDWIPSVSGVHEGFLSKTSVSGVHQGVLSKTSVSGVLRGFCQRLQCQGSTRGFCQRLQCQGSWGGSVKDFSVRGPPGGTDGRM